MNAISETDVERTCHKKEGKVPKTGALYVCSLQLPMSAKSAEGGTLSQRTFSTWYGKGMLSELPEAEIDLCVSPLSCVTY